MIVLEWSPLVRFNIQIVFLKCSIITLYFRQEYWELHKVCCELFFLFLLFPFPSPSLSSFSLFLPLLNLFLLSPLPALHLLLQLYFFFPSSTPPSLPPTLFFVCFSFEVGRDNGGGGRFLLSLTDIGFAGVNSNRSHRESFVLILGF